MVYDINQIHYIGLKQFMTYAMENSQNNNVCNHITHKSKMHFIPNNFCISLVIVFIIITLIFQTKIKQMNLFGEIWITSGIYIPTSVSEWKLRTGKSSNLYLSFSIYDSAFIGNEIDRDKPVILIVN